MSVVYLNGVFLPPAQARVPVLDRGFMFGDAVYEVIPVYDGRPFRMDEHLLRLGNSLRLVRITNPFSLGQWRDILDKLVKQNPGRDQSVYLQVTRGVAERDHVLESPVQPTLFAMSTPIDGTAIPQPVSAILCPDTRWQYCHIKTTSLLANVLLRHQAADNGAFEAILIRDGFLTEGAASNVFIVSSGIVKTPPQAPQLLPGITRDLLVELMAANRLAHQETAIPEQAVRDAEEIWLTSSTREIVPVVKLDGEAVGDGEPGPLWTRVFEIYQGAKG